MRKVFSFISFENGRIEIDGKLKSAIPNDSPLSELVLRAQFLVESAAAFFSGIYPSDAPHAWWWDGIYLPWHPSYPGLESDGFHYVFDLTVNDIRPFVEIIRTVPYGKIPFECGRLIYESKLHRTPKLRVQGIAAEVMVSADKFLSCISKKQLPQAMQWLSVAYSGICHATEECRHIFIGAAERDSIGRLTRRALESRHKENRAMKKQVFEWYSVNRANYRSMDAAAQAITNRIAPITFRTARAWITEYRKQVQSPRKP